MIKIIVDYWWAVIITGLITVVVGGIAAVFGDRNIQLNLSLNPLEL